MIDAFRRFIARLPGGGTIFALACVMGLDSSDQATIGATAPEVRAAFAISQTQIGLLSTSSTIVGVVFTLPFGVLADRADRIRMLRIVILLWTVAMVSVGASPTYPYMLSSHCFLGLVTGAAGPLIASIVGDLVPREQRGRVYSVLLVGELVGAAIGTGFAGELAAGVGWREAYWLLAVAGLSVLLVLTKAHEPLRRSARLRRRGTQKIGDRPAERGPLASDEAGHLDDKVGDDAAAQQEVPPVPLGRALLTLIRIPTNVILVLASSLGYFYFTGVQTFGVSLLTEDYTVPRAVAPLLVLAVGASLAGGVLIGGPVGDRLVARGHRLGRVVTVLVAFIGAVVFLVPGLSFTNIFVTMPLLVLAGLLLGAANPPLDATRIDIVPNALLGRAEALRTAMRDGADAAAPVLFGAVSVGLGLRSTFLLMTIALGAAFVLGATALRTYIRDADRADSWDHGEATAGLAQLK